MVYYTGDIHGNAKAIAAFAQYFELTESDTIVILGDVGANYYGNRRDRYCKDVLARIKPTVFCIDNEDIGFVITENGLPDMVLIPFRWFAENFPDEVPDGL